MNPLPGANARAMYLVSATFLHQTENSTPDPVNRVENRALTTSTSSRRASGSPP
jgi:hypothetical protein